MSTRRWKKGEVIKIQQQERAKVIEEQHHKHQIDLKCAREGAKQKVIEEIERVVEIAEICENNKFNSQDFDKLIFQLKVKLKQLSENNNEKG